MKKFIDRLQNTRFTEKSAPFALLAAMLLAFGLLIPWLGFYQDDWHHIYYAYARGTGSLWELLNYDARPFAAWVYVIGFSLLGFRPIAWQFTSLILRWLTVVFIWATFKQLWPKQTRQNFTAALIFAIYPFFVIQPLSVAYSMHWTGYLLYALSIWLMLLATKTPRRFVLFTIFALIFETVHLFTLEYYFGIELLRPILLWFVLDNENRRAKVIRILRQWLPYLFIFLVYFIWRGFLYQSPVVTEQGIARGVPDGLNNLLTTPLQTVLSMFLNLIPDMVLLLFSSWHDILTPDSANFNFATNILALVPALIGGIFTYLYTWHLKNNSTETDSHWKRQALVLGTTACIFGILTIYGGGFSTIYTMYFPWNARFMLGSFFGAGLLVTVALESLFSSRQTRQVVLALLIGLTIGRHVRFTNIFRHAWETETDFYSQITLRIPSIAPHTAFLAKGESIPIMGDYPISFALNTIYSLPLGAPSKQTKTWLFFVDTNFDDGTGRLLSGMSFLKKRFSAEFTGKSTDSIVIKYEPDLGQCLWIITPENADAQIIPETLRTISSLSNTKLIEPSSPPTPFLQVILPSRPDTWCTYYQRGSLALQLQEWSKATSLWEEAKEKGLRPSNGFEYLPFIESYGLIENWQESFELTKVSNKLSKGMEDTLCALWNRLLAKTTPTPERENTSAKAKDYLGCK